jgi:hypothetical protein
MYSKRHIAVALFANAIVASAASATNSYEYYDVVSDVGTYDPLVLGEDLNLDACGSYVVNANDANETYGLCDFQDWSLDYDFSIIWTVSYGGTTTTIGQYSGQYTDSGNSADGNASDGLQISTATGAGTLFNAVGNYVIGLWIDMDDNDSIYLPNNSYQYTGGDGGTTNSWTQNNSGYINIDYSSVSLGIEAVSVPEPAAALLLIPGLIMLRRREKLRRAAAL